MSGIGRHIKKYFTISYIVKIVTIGNSVLSVFLFISYIYTAGCVMQPRVERRFNHIDPAALRLGSFLANIYKEFLPNEHYVVLDSKLLNWTDVKTWQPDELDVRLARTALLRCVRWRNPLVSSQLDKYGCQYFGFLKSGKKYIYCNCFRFLDSEITGRWGEQPIVVLGGGDSFFQIYYNLEERLCDDVEMGNGF